MNTRHRKRAADSRKWRTRKVEQGETDSRKPMEKNREVHWVLACFKHCLGLCSRELAEGKIPTAQATKAVPKLPPGHAPKKPASFPHVWAENHGWHQLACEASKAATQDACSIQEINPAAWVEKQKVEKEKWEKSHPWYFNSNWLAQYLPFCPCVFFLFVWLVLFVCLFFVEEKPSVSLFDSLILP